MSVGSLQLNLRHKNNEPQVDSCPDNREKGSNTRDGPAEDSDSGLGMEGLISRDIHEEEMFEVSLKEG